MDDCIITTRTRGHSVHLMNRLSSLLVSELLSPGRELYLISPWLSNMVIIDNRFAQYRALLRDLDKEELRLADILHLLAQRGTTVHIIARPDHALTKDFLQGLPKHKGISWRFNIKEHEKGLISPHFCLSGSMNFTYSGVNINKERVELSINPEKVFSIVRLCIINGESSL
jgi:phosphatidylserine/phosphatidylglycerophosphate/cardiolipin synthase-like enzyme